MSAEPQVVVLDDLRPHMTVCPTCQDCGYSWIAVCPSDTNTTRLECPECGVCETATIRTDIAGGIVLNAIQAQVRREVRKALEGRYDA